MSSRMKWSSVLALGLVMACVSTQAVRLGTTAARQPVSPDKVAIYRTAELVPGRYEEIALLSSSGDQSFTSEGQMYDSMRKKAGQMGANAVVLQQVKDASTAAQIGASLGLSSADRKGKAIAIFVYPKDSAIKQP